MMEREIILLVISQNHAKLWKTLVDYPVSSVLWMISSSAKRDLIHKRDDVIPKKADIWIMEKL